MKQIIATTSFTHTKLWGKL